MKLGTVRMDGHERAVVAVDDDTAAVLEPGVTVAGLLAEWQDGRPTVEQEPRLPVADLHWLPPIPRPGKIICVALNNSANTDRIMSGPDTPATFIKPASSLVGSGQPIRLRASYGRVHPEPELAVVIGAGGFGIERDAAIEHVFGYTIMNDLTSPTMRAQDTFHYRAIHPSADGSPEITYVDTWVTYSGRYKGADTFGPIGPWITTRDEIPDPHALTVRCTHDGRVITEDSTANLLHTVADVVSYSSQYMTLEPGDIISMGTALKASATGGAVQNVDLTKLGGVIDVSISGIGTLTNPVAIQ